MIGQPKSDISMFLKSGCKIVGFSENQYLSCAESDSPLLRACNSFEDVAAELSALPYSTNTLRCYFEGSSDTLTNDTAIRYEGCGMSSLYSKYVVATEHGFIDISNASEFAKVFGPVDSPAKALGFAVALTTETAKYQISIPSGYPSSVDHIEPTHVEVMDNGYVVNLFGYHCPGCGPHYYYEVEYFVSRQGGLTERKRTNLYRDPKEDNLCMD